MQEIIDILEEIYTSEDFIYEKMLLQFFNLSGITFHTVPLKQGSHLVRARYSDKMESFVNLVDVSYPPKCSVTNFSKLNRPNQNLFYASECKTSCLLEMLPFWFEEFKTGDKIQITLGTWVLHKDLELLVLPDTTSLNDLYSEVILKMDPGESPFWDYITSKFKSTTKDDKNVYEFTAAFANALRLKTLKNGFNGFIYSSVHQANRVNIALSTDILDSKLLTPAYFQEIIFERTGIDDEGLPTYQSIGFPKVGLIKSDTSQIKWNC